MNASSTQNFELISKQEKYFFEASTNPLSIKLRLRVRISKTDTKIYEKQIISLKNMSKLEDYCSSFEQVREYLKDTVHTTIDPSQAIITINGRHPIKKDKKIELAVINLPLVNTLKNDLQIRIDQLQNSMEILKQELNRKKQNKQQEFFTRKQLKTELDKLKDALQKQYASAIERHFQPPSMMDSVIDCSMVKDLALFEGEGGNPYRSSITDYLNGDKRDQSTKIESQALQIANKVQQSFLKFMNQTQKQIERLNSKLVEITQVKIESTDAKQKRLQQRILRAVKVSQWSHITRIRQLNLSHEGIEQLPLDFMTCTELQELNLSKNRITEIPNSISNFMKLRQLDLSHNKLKELPGSIQKLQNLMKLNVQNNNLSQLPTGIGNIKSLTYLQLSSNRLEELPDSICSLSNLQTLYAFNNQLKVLPDQIGELSQLQKLSLFGNQIQTLPKSFESLSKLKILWIKILSKSEMLSTLPENMTGLRFLFIDYSADDEETKQKLLDLQMKYYNTNLKLRLVS